MKGWTEHRHFWLRFIGWLMVAGVVVLSLIRLPATPLAVSGGDKLLHLGTYAILTYWFLHTHPARPLAIVLGFMGLGTALEGLQTLTGYRYLEVMDWLMNVTGVVLAWLVFYGLRWRIKYLMP
ncbi:VanZ family protein [Marinicella meishanensis]|uniref:VanZ family protein n=1 Tax=Marinicella meishanensis TaxID=2873263 RepID=UPI001CBD4452|nr:VanZ family protein [Marinicella sp. NBU2979]